MRRKPFAWKKNSSILALAVAALLEEREQIGDGERMKERTNEPRSRRENGARGGEKEAASERASQPASQRADEIERKLKEIEENAA